MAQPDILLFFKNLDVEVTTDSPGTLAEFFAQSWATVTILIEDDDLWKQHGPFFRECQLSVLQRIVTKNNDVLARMDSLGMKHKFVKYVENIIQNKMSRLELRAFMDLDKPQKQKRKSKKKAKSLADMVARPSESSDPDASRPTTPSGATITPLAPALIPVASSSAGASALIPLGTTPRQPQTVMPNPIPLGTIGRPPHEPKPAMTASAVVAESISKALAASDILRHSLVKTPAPDSLSTIVKQTASDAPLVSAPSATSSTAEPSGQTRTHTASRARSLQRASSRAPSLQRASSRAPSPIPSSSHARSSAMPAALSDFSPSDMEDVVATPTVERPHPDPQYPCQPDERLHPNGVCGECDRKNKPCIQGHAPREGGWATACVGCSSRRGKCSHVKKKQLAPSPPPQLPQASDPSPLPPPPQMPQAPDTVSINSEPEQAPRPSWKARGKRKEVSTKAETSALSPTGVEEGLQEDITAATLAALDRSTAYQATINSTLSKLSHYMASHQIQMTAIQAVLSFLVEHSLGTDSEDLQELGLMLKDIQGGIPWWLRSFEAFEDEDMPAAASMNDATAVAKQISRARLLATIPPGFALEGMLLPSHIVGSSSCLTGPRIRRGSTPPELFLQEPTPASTQLTVIQTQDPTFLAVPEPDAASPLNSQSYHSSPGSSDEPDEPYVPVGWKRAAVQSPPVKHRMTKRSRDES